MKQILLAMVFITLVGCKKDAQQINQTTNSEFKVDFLFENDGCKVYRFMDAGNYVYYTDCTGKISYEYTSGKTHHKTETLNNSTDADSLQ